MKFDGDLVIEQTITVGSDIYPEISGTSNIGTNVKPFNEGYFKTVNLISPAAGILRANNDVDNTTAGSLILQTPLGNNVITQPIEQSAKTYYLPDAISGAYYLTTDTITGAGNVTISILGDGILVSGSGGGSSNHDELNNLDYASAGHTGFVSITTSQYISGAKTFTSTLTTSGGVLPSSSGTEDIGSVSSPYDDVFGNNFKAVATGTEGGSVVLGNFASTTASYLEVYDGGYNKPGYLKIYCENGTPYYFAPVCSPAGFYVSSSTPDGDPAGDFIYGTNLVSGTGDIYAGNFRGISENIRNITINSGFDFWRRGTSFSNPTYLDYMADAWIVRKDGTPNFTVSREPTEVDSGLYSCKINITAVGGGWGTYVDIYQVVKDSHRYNNKVLTLSARVKSGTASKAKIGISDDSGTSYSSLNSGTGWETLSVSRTITATLTNSVKISLFVTSGAAVIAYYDSVMLVLGSTSLGYVASIPIVSLQLPDMIHYNLTSNQTITYDVTTKLTGFTKVVDTYNYWDNSNHRFTPRVAGYYIFFGRWDWAAGAPADQYVYAYIFKNTNTTVGYIYDWILSGKAKVQLVYSIPVYLNGSTDYVEMYARCSTANNTVYGGSSFWCFKISDDISY